MGLLCGDQGSILTELPLSPGAGCTQKCVFVRFVRSRRRESARLYQWYERGSVTKRPQVMHLGLVFYLFSVLIVPRPREVDSKMSEYTGAVFVQLRDTPNCADCTNARLLSMRSCWPHCEVWGFGQG